MDPLVIFLVCVSAAAIAVTLGVVMATTFGFIVDNPDHWFSRPWVICWDAIKAAMHRVLFDPLARVGRQMRHAVARRRV